MFELIHKKLKHTEAYPCLLSVLHHCLQMPCEYPALAVTLVLGPGQAGGDETLTPLWAGESDISFCTCLC
jgi:hypothetical protein